MVDSLRLLCKLMCLYILGKEGQVIPKNIHSIQKVASWNSKGEGGFLEWNSEGIMGVMQFRIPNSWGWGARGGGGLKGLCYLGRVWIISGITQWAI